MNHLQIFIKENVSIFCVIQNPNRSTITDNLTCIFVLVLLDFLFDSYRDLIYTSVSESKINTEGIKNTKQGISILNAIFFRIFIIF